MPRAPVVVVLPIPSHPSRISQALPVGASPAQSKRRLKTLTTSLLPQSQPPRTYCYIPLCTWQCEHALKDTRSCQRTSCPVFHLIRDHTPSLAQTSQQHCLNTRLLLQTPRRSRHSTNNINLSSSLLTANYQSIPTPTHNPLAPASRPVTEDAAQSVQQKTSRAWCVANDAATRHAECL